MKGKDPLNGPMHGDYIILRDTAIMRQGTYSTMREFANLAIEISTLQESGDGHRYLGTDRKTYESCKDNLECLYKD